jgi:hypothetical protein
MIKRKSIEYIKNNTTEPLIGMEVGVYTGDNALNIVENLSIEKLYLVDPYTMYRDYNVLDLPISLDNAKEIACKKLQDYNVQWVYKKFEDCNLLDFNSLKLDFIYIDGEHSSEVFEKDLKLAASLIKPDGFLCGHDANFPEIKKVLDEWIKGKDLTLSLFENTADNSMDWLIK